MESILQNTPATISETWYEDGVAVDPGTVTVGITRADGSVLVAAGTATGGSTTSPRTYALTATHTALLDILTVTWTSTLKGTLTSRVVIDGGFYFTIAEFKARYPNDADVTALSADEVQRGRQIAEELIERACHVAFVPRAKRLTVAGNWSTALRIPLYLLRSVQSVTVDDAVVTDLSGYKVADGAIYRSASFPRGVGNAQVTVTHGYDEPPEEIKDAAIVLAFHKLIKGPIDDRATSLPAGDAGGTIQLLTPGVGNAITGIPVVDQAILAYRLPHPGSVSSVLTASAANTYPDNMDSFAIG